MTCIKQTDRIGRAGQGSVFHMRRQARQPLHARSTDTMVLLLDPSKVFSRSCRAIASAACGLVDILPAVLAGPDIRHGRALRFTRSVLPSRATGAAMTPM